MELRLSAAKCVQLLLVASGFWIPVMADVPTDAVTTETGFDLWSIIGAGALALVVLSRRLRTR